MKMTTFSRYRLGIGTALVAVSLAPACWAQGMPGRAAAVDPHDVSGFWELTFDGRHVPPAQLAESVTKDQLQVLAEKDAKAVRWCNILGMPFLMGLTRPLDIRQGRREIVIAAESPVVVPRHIYLDRADHIGKDIFDPTTNGDSIAHWEADTLVADTVGFEPEHGMTAVPGGGYRSADAHLVERFKLLKNGTMLSVTSTWTDPKVFRVPQTYEFRYQRAARDYEARQPIPCDPFDEDRAAFLGGSTSVSAAAK
jgi:hypothetical protein